MRQVSSGHAIAAVLVGLTVALAGIAAIAVARIDTHRAKYEETVAEAYRAETTAWRRAGEAGPQASVRARRAAAAAAVRAARRRASARRQLDDRKESTVVAAAGAGGVALVLAVGLVGAVAARLRRPVEQLATAAREVLGGRPPGRGGPGELRALAAALDALAADQRPGRAALPPPGNGEVVAALEEFGQPLVLCDATGHVTHLNERARHLLPDARVGAPIGHAEFDAEGWPLAGRTRVTLAGRTLGLAVARAEEGPESLWVVRDLGPAPL